MPIIFFDISEASSIYHEESASVDAAKNNDASFNYSARQKNHQQRRKMKRQNANQLGQNKQNNQRGRNIQNQGHTLRGYGSQTGQSKQINVNDDNISNQAQNQEDFSYGYGGYSSLSPMDSNYRPYFPNPALSGTVNSGGTQVSPGFSKFQNGGSQIGISIGNIQQNVNTGDISQFNTAMQNGRANAANLAQQGNYGGSSSLNQNEPTGSP